MKNSIEFEFPIDEHDDLIAIADITPACAGDRITPETPASVNLIEFFDGDVEVEVSAFDYARAEEKALEKWDEERSEEWFGGEE